MNSCEHYQELISRLVDADVSREEYEELLAHMNTCSRCSALYAVFYDLSEIIGSEESVELPEGLHENIMAGVRRSDLEKKNRRTRRIWTRTVLTAAACLALVLFAMRGFSPADRAESSVVRSEEAADVMPAPAAEEAPATPEIEENAAPAAEATPSPVPAAVPKASAAPKQSPAPVSPSPETAPATPTPATPTPATPTPATPTPATPTPATPTPATPTPATPTPATPTPATPTPATPTEAVKEPAATASMQLEPKQPTQTETPAFFVMR